MNARWRHTRILEDSAGRWVTNRRACCKGSGCPFVGALADRSAAVAIAPIWLAHIGGNRMIGSGLKYPSAFKDTHLQRV